MLILIESVEKFDKFDLISPHRPMFDSDGRLGRLESRLAIMQARTTNAEQYIHQIYRRSAFVEYFDNKMDGSNKMLAFGRGAEISPGGGIFRLFLYPLTHS
ncbi:hypothetical protein DMA12_26470 [Amycolatopsis balhimycina DSM 5908]|uniref:Uncharacterized protein n=1 Tax=Amycolatopsis balhimycina DSM 5908 TaxID=1081091 RepID=A0A428WCE5_AMYBA|nr:hypothetical protein DMA12_26470 [Amycolatopsis balhimycina DSM 5908]